MSLDIYMYNSDGEEVPVDLNITHNLNKMADAAGYYEYIWRPDETEIYQNGVVRCSFLVGKLEEALLELLRNREKYVAHNPSNGWGSYEGLVNFLTRYIIACHENIGGIVEISR